MKHIGTLLDSRELKYVDWDDKTGKGSQPAEHWTLANLVSSQSKQLKDHHFPVIDLDFDCDLLPSSTPGHHHLYINKPLNNAQYKTLLEALFVCGIIQKGILDQFNREGFTCVRLPWVHKDAGNVSYPESKILDL